MPGPIQITMILMLIGLTVAYLLFFRSLALSNTNLITKVFWIVISLVLPLIGIFVYYVLGKHIRIQLN